MGGGLGIMEEHCSFQKRREPRTRATGRLIDDMSYIILILFVYPQSTLHM